MSPARHEAAAVGLCHVFQPSAGRQWCTESMRAFSALHVQDVSHTPVHPQGSEGSGTGPSSSRCEVRGPGADPSPSMSRQQRLSQHLGWHQHQHQRWGLGLGCPAWRYCCRCGWLPRVRLPPRLLLLLLLLHIHGWQAGPGACARRVRYKHTSTLHYIVSTNVRRPCLNCSSQRINP